MENEVKDNPHKINEILIATASENRVSEAYNALHNRSLLYEWEEEALYMKFNDELLKLGMLPDKDNIVYRPDKDREKVDRIALNEYIHVNGIKVEDPEDRITDWYAHKLLLTKSGEGVYEPICLTRDKNVLELVLEKDGPSYSGEYIAGELLVGSKTDGTISHYNISLMSTALQEDKTPALIGSTSLSAKAKLVKCTRVDGTVTFGLKFKGLKNDDNLVFFTGWYRHGDLTPIVDNANSYDDIIEIKADDGSGGSSGAGGGMIYRNGDTYQVLSDSELAARKLLPPEEKTVETSKNGFLQETNTWQLVKMDFRVGDFISPIELEGLKLEGNK